MKKVLFLLLICAMFSCQQRNNYIKDCCQETADSMINHISKEWHVISSSYAMESEAVYADVTDGTDTLVIIAESTHGTITTKGVVFSTDVNTIKRHNLAIKRLCNGDSIFRFELIRNKILNATFYVQIQREKELPPEEYGL